jgi:outer membrane protein TolC
MNRLFASCLALLAVSSAAWAQGPAKVTLEQAQTWALQNAYAMKYAALDQQMAQRDIKELRAQGLPQLGLTADYNQFIEIPTQVVPGDAFGFPPYLIDFFGGVSDATGVVLNAPAPDPDGLSELQFGNKHTANVGIQASQLLFSGSYLVGLQAARRYAASREEALARTADEVMKQVAEAYFLVAAAEANLAILTESRDAAQQQVLEMGAMHAAGFADITAVEQLELAVSELEAGISNARAQRELSLGLLRFQMGLKFTDPLEISEKLPDLTERLQAQGEWMVTLNYGDLPALREMEAQVELARLDVKNKQAAALPVVSAFYSNARNAQRTEFDLFQSGGRWYPAVIWGVQLSVPLWTSGGGVQRVEKAKLQVARAEAGLQQMQEAADLEQRAAVQALEQAAVALRQRERAADLAQRIHQRTEAAFREGVASSFELAQARNQSIQARGQATGAQLEWLNARVRLQAALSAFPMNP